jgi:2-succinyl-5-enolpyruvyl-6-hydroxy-3-cyclohexene-1-carboxylate synthase
MQQHVYTISQTCEAAGIKHAVICPGSRSAPLVYAFTSGGIHCYSVVDERSAAYMALGMAQQLNEPVVLICTSGTAALNFFPAVAEAFYQKIPLLILTADRPQELLNQQDGQMIMQRNVYGQHVRASLELPCYEEGRENEAETRRIVLRALKATLEDGRGPAHINIPLREPLYPGTLVKTNSAFVEPFVPKDKTPSAAERSLIGQVWKKSNKKLVLVGQMPCDGSLNGALHELQQHEDVVIVCDILSNQYEWNTAPQFDYLLQRADAQTLDELVPDCIISLGGPVLSKALKKWLQSIKPSNHIRFNAGPEKVDTYQNVTHSFQGNPAALLFQLGMSGASASNTRYKQFWQLANTIVAERIKDFLGTERWSELYAMNEVLKSIPDAANVQVGNSSIIRYLSNLGSINPSWVMNGNRGTSGIDGCTSTAVGAARVNNRPTYLLTGDIAFLYDINALWGPLPNNLKIVLFNNQGGGIFRLLEGPRKHKQQLDYFTTPHNRSIKQIALQNGLQHYLCTGRTEFQKATRFFDPTSGPSLIEIQVDMERNQTVFEQFKSLPL